MATATNAGTDQRTNANADTRQTVSCKAKQYAPSAASLYYQAKHGISDTQTSETVTQELNMLHAIDRTADGERTPTIRSTHCAGLRTDLCTT